MPEFKNMWFCEAITVVSPNEIQNIKHWLLWELNSRLLELIIQLEIKDKMVCVLNYYKHDV